MASESITASSTMASGPEITLKEKKLLDLYKQQYGNLRDYLRKLIGPGPPDPEDIAQTAFTKLANRRDLEDIRHLPSFLWRTARNILISEQRKNRVRQINISGMENCHSARTTDDIDPERVLMAKAETAIILALLKSMKPQRRTILLMSRLEGHSNAEIGRRLGLARSTVSEHLARAMMELDMAINEAEGGEQ